MHAGYNSNASILNPRLVLYFPLSVAIIFSLFMFAIPQLHVSQPVVVPLSQHKTCLNINKSLHPYNTTVIARSNFPTP
jgi:hypothetical protein